MTTHANESIESRLKDSANLLIEAPPGCGKTELLATRASNIVSMLTKGEKILALTFTNRATANLRSRLNKIMGEQAVRRHVQIRNLHGMATEIVMAHGKTLGLDTEKLLLPRTSTLRTAFRRFSTDKDGIDKATKLLAEIKRQPLSDGEVLEQLADSGNSLAIQVETHRQASGQLHFEDLLRHAQRLLRIEAIQHLYSLTYRGIIVDEFQDLSLQQYEISTKLCDRVLTYAGDLTQGIYSWAGAAPSEVEAKLLEVCGAPVRLNVSYRSSPGALSVINHIAADLDASPLNSYDPSRWFDGGISVAVAFATRAEEAAFIHSVSAQIFRADPTSSIGVVARSAWRRKEVDLEFGHLEDLPVRRWDLALDDPQILKLIESSVSTMSGQIELAAACEVVLEAVDPIDVETVGQVRDAFDQLQAQGSESLQDALRRSKLIDPSSPVGPGLHILTGHIGKGQEFDWVFVIGLEEEHTPDYRSKSAIQIEEELRILHVMASRARHGLILTRSETSQNQYGRIFPSRPSRWWQGVEESSTEDGQGLLDHLTRRYPSVSIT